MSVHHLKSVPAVEDRKGAVAVATEAWGDAMPLWVRRLAEACEQTSQNKVAKRLERSPALVSQVLNNKYQAELDLVEELVTGKLLAGTRDCPELGSVTLDACQNWRRKARVFNGANSQGVKMYRACHRCPIYQKEART